MQPESDPKRHEPARGGSLVERVDRTLIPKLRRYGHRAHRISIGILFVWFGLLKPFGLETTSSLLAHTVYWGEPDQVVLVLGWWEVAIGLCLMVRPLIRLALVLLVVRLFGILLAFALLSEVCFVHFPLGPTLEGQYLIKDLTIFFAAIAIAGALREDSTPERLH